MIIIDDKENIPQGGEAWLKLRAGKPSASNFKKIVTSTGALSKSADDHMVELAYERIAGEKTPTYKNGNMERGNEFEPEACAVFEMNQQLEARTVSLCMTDDESILCSPDALIGNDCGLEIKCKGAKAHWKELKAGKLPTEHIQQVQGCMYVTGAKSWYYMSYFPSVRPLIIKIERDDVFIAKLAFELDQFNKQLAILTAQIRGE